MKQPGRGLTIIAGLLALILSSSANLNAAAAHPSTATALLKHNFPALSDRLTESSLTADHEVLNGQLIEGFRFENTAGARHVGSPVSVLLPADYRRPLIAHTGTISVGLQALDARAVNLDSSRGAVYPDAYPETDVMYVPAQGVIEEFLVERTASAPTQIRYRIADQHGVKEVALKDGAIWFKPELNGPAMMLVRPVVYDARGKRSDSAASWQLNGRDLVLNISPAGLTYPIVVDPTFYSLSQPRAARTKHTATLLNSGGILVAGGLGSNGTPVAFGEVFNADFNRFDAVGNMQTPRELHAATLLPNGTVLIAGGLDGSANRLASTEIFSPTTGGFATGPSMTTARTAFTATLLRDGRVLVVGGITAAGTPTNTAEIFNGTTFAPLVSTMAVARSAQSATLMPDNKVVIVGGLNLTGISEPTIEIFDPTTNTFSAGGSLITGRTEHTATVLDNGLVLVAGGAGLNGVVLNSTEIYNETTKTTTPGPTLSQSRLLHTANRLNNGDVVLVGGTSANNVILASSEIYHRATNTISPGPSMTMVRTGHTATVAHEGDVVVIAGANQSGDAALTQTAEAMTIDYGTFKVTGAPASARSNFTTNPLADGTVLIAGGLISATASNLAEIYNPVSNTFSPTVGAMNVSRSGQSGTLMANGQVLIAGGTNAGSGIENSAEIYNPIAGTFTLTGSMNEHRTNHTATLLADGQVLVTGGKTSTQLATCTAEVYNPNTGTWTIVNSMNDARVSHSATLMPNNLVLVAGGFGGDGHTSLGSADLYNPATGTFTATGQLVVPRALHSATQMDGNFVLLTGGDFNGTALTNTEVFAPALGRFFPLAPLHAAREGHTATRLPNGQVLIAGGQSGTTKFSSAELYDGVFVGFYATISNMINARAFGGAALLPNGKVLLVDGSGSIAAAELFDHSTVTGVAPAPTLGAVGSPLVPGSTVTLSGSGFEGAEVSGGNDAQNSSSNIPVPFLRRIEQGIAQELPVTAFSDTSVTVKIPASLQAGSYVLNVVSGGRSSALAYSNVAANPVAPTGSLPSSLPVCILPTPTPAPSAAQLSTYAEAFPVTLNSDSFVTSNNLPELFEAEAPSLGNNSQRTTASSIIVPLGTSASVSVVSADSKAAVTYTPSSGTASTNIQHAAIDLSGTSVAGTQGPIITVDGVIAACSSATSLSGASSNANGSQIGSVTVTVNGTPNTKQVTQGLIVEPINGYGYLIFNCQSPNSFDLSKACQGPGGDGVNNSSLDVKQVWLIIDRRFGAPFNLNMVIGEAECSAGSNTRLPPP